MTQAAKTFTAWLAKARQNELFVYHKEFEERRPREFQAAMVAHEGRTVFLSIRRGPEGLEWTARRCKVQDRALLDLLSKRIPSPPRSRWAD